MSTSASAMPSHTTLSESQSATAESLETGGPDPSAIQPKAKKKGLLGLLKRKDGKDGNEDGMSPETTPTASSATANTTSPSATTPAKPIPRSISPGPQPLMTPPSNLPNFPGSPQSHVSPSRYARSSSPRLHSPASSLIFERNVQEAPLPDDLQAAIPHHIQTEDYIPPILEASSHAITDEKLNPDEVEIVMHSAHQPAATTIAHQEPGIGSGTLSPLSLGHGSDAPTLSPSAGPESTAEEHASHYGALDANDVRRLSFISFADVVQGEHALDGSVSALPKELHMSIMSTTTNRSPSPIRSPASSHGPGEFGMSPPTSGAPSMKGVDMSGKQSSVGGFAASPGSLGGTNSPPLVGGELTVETMSQALRKTGSGDLSSGRSPVSPIEKTIPLLSGAPMATDEAK